MNYRTRAQWGATFDPSSIPLIAVPVRLLFIHHNVIEPTNDANHDMERTEQVDIGRFGNPSYDWAIHPSGVVLEGMTRHLSPDTYGHNRDSHSIMFMGNFETDEPTDAAMFACRELIHTLKLFGNVTQDVTIFGHRDTYPTACPGANLYPRLGELYAPPPIPSPEYLGDENMCVIYNGSQYLLHAGKLMKVTSPLPSSLPQYPVDQVGWQAITKPGALVVV